LLTLFEHRFETLHPDIDVRWLEHGLAGVYDRLRSERANPQADVWFGGPSLVLARRARLAARLLAPCVADAIAPRGRGAGDCYFAAYETPVAFLYAEKVVSRRRRRRIGRAARSQVETEADHPRPLASGTMRAVFGFIIQRGMKQTGDTSAGSRGCAGSTRRRKSMSKTRPW